MVEVRLYTTEGMHIGTVEADAEPVREGVLESDGNTYIWNQRNGQWRQVSDVVKLKKPTAVQNAPQQPPEPSIVKSPDKG